MRISDWSSDVCSSDLAATGSAQGCPHLVVPLALAFAPHAHRSSAKSGRPRSTPAPSDSGTRTPGDENSNDVDGGEPPMTELLLGLSEELTQENSVDMAKDPSKGLGANTSTSDRKPAV